MFLHEAFCLLYVLTLILVFEGFYALRGKP